MDDIQVLIEIFERAKIEFLIDQDQDDDGLMSLTMQVGGKESYALLEFDPYHENKLLSFSIR